MIADTRILDQTTGEVIAFPGDELDDEDLYRLEIGIGLPIAAVKYLVIDLPGGYTATPCIWAECFVGWSVWTRRGSCIGVFTDLATAQRHAVANAKLYSMHRWRQGRRRERSKQ